MAALKNTTINDTGFLSLPSGNTAQRPVSPATGMIRYNTTDRKVECYINGDWYGVVVQAILPVTSGLVGWYDATKWDGSSWLDSSGSGNHATTIRGAISQTTTDYTSLGAQSTFTSLSGNTSAGIQFPNTILPATFTLFHVTRYNAAIGVTGGNEVGRGRILDGVTPNWLDGFWSGGSGKSFHDGWITPTDIDYHGNYWVISSSQNSRYRSKSKNANGGNWYNFTGGGGTSKQLSVNYGHYTVGGEASNWMIAEVIVYNRTLSDSELTSMETYLSTKYGI
jgi:hypothetical protein